MLKKRFFFFLKLQKTYFSTNFRADLRTLKKVFLLKFQKIETYLSLHKNKNVKLFFLKF
jgi:hypothetical protein